MPMQAKQALTTTYHLDLLHRYLENASLGIAVVEPRIWECERAYARSHPQIRAPSREVPKILENLHEFFDNLRIKVGARGCPDIFKRFSLCPGSPVRPF